MDNNYLSHYGVPGMRWGHRKASIVSDTKKGPPRNSTGGLYNKHKMPKDAKVDGPMKRTKTFPPDQDIANLKKFRSNKRATNAVGGVLAAAGGVSLLTVTSMALIAGKQLLDVLLENA